MPDRQRPTPFQRKWKSTVSASSAQNYRGWREKVRAYCDYAFEYLQTFIKEQAWELLTATLVQLRPRVFRRRDREEVWSYIPPPIDKIRTPLVFSSSGAINQ